MADLLDLQQPSQKKGVIEGLITHLEELKDAFPTRIEVEKTAQGSAVTVV